MSNLCWPCTGSRSRLPEGPWCGDDRSKPVPEDGGPTATILHPSNPSRNETRGAYTQREWFHSKAGALHISCLCYMENTTCRSRSIVLGQTLRPHAVSCCAQRMARWLKSGKSAPAPDRPSGDPVRHRRILVFRPCAERMLLDCHRITCAFSRSPVFRTRARSLEIRATPSHPWAWRNARGRALP